MSLSPRQRAFTLLDLIATLAGILILVVGLLVIASALGPTARRGAPQMTNNAQLRGIHRALVIYAQSNKKGGNDGFFPGLDASGNVIPDGPDTGFSGDGTQPGARLIPLLNGNFVTPDYIINPADPIAREIEVAPGMTDYQHLKPINHSYAMLAISPPPGSGRNDEWKETLNTAAIMLSDRAIGHGPADISSVWTDPGSGDWKGGVVRNDNATHYEQTTSFENTRYGTNPANAWDELFEDESGGADAFLVHDDAITAFSRN